MTDPVRLRSVSAFDIQPGLKDALSTSTGYFRTQMRLIQHAKRMRREDDIEDLHTHMHEHEKEYLSAVFDRLRPECSWQEIADRLGIGLTTLERRRERYGLP